MGGAFCLVNGAGFLESFVPYGPNGHRGVILKHSNVNELMIRFSAFVLASILAWVLNLLRKWMSLIRTISHLLVLASNRNEGFPQLVLSLKFLE